MPQNAILLAFCHPELGGLDDGFCYKQVAPDGALALRRFKRIDNSNLIRPNLVAVYYTNPVYR